MTDGLFSHGYHALHEANRDALVQLGPATSSSDIVARVLEMVRVNVTWHLEHPQLGQLMLFRPIPAWQPSQAAYATSIELAQTLVAELRAYRELGHIRPDVEPLDAFEDLANLITGVVARHLSNEPGARYSECQTSRTFPALVSTVVRSYLH